MQLVEQTDGGRAALLRRTPRRRQPWTATLVRWATFTPRFRGQHQRLRAAPCGVTKRMHPAKRPATRMPTANLSMRKGWSMSTSPGVAVTVASVGMLIAGCVDTVAGQAVGYFDDPFHVAGTARRGRSIGIYDRTPSDPSVRSPTAMAAQSMCLPPRQSATSRSSGLAHSPISASTLSRWPDSSHGTPNDTCERAVLSTMDTYQFVNAAYCLRDDTVGWDRGELIPMLRSSFDDMAFATVFAHEYGHVVQRQADLTGPDTTTDGGRTTG